MNLSFVRTIPAFDALAMEWNELLTHSASDVPFLRHEFLRAWWNQLGGGEWQNGALYIVLGRSEDGNLRAIAPLFLSESPDGENTLLFLGSHEIADFLDVIARPEDLRQFLTAVLTHLTGNQGPPWTSITLFNIMETSPTLPALRAAAEAVGWIFQEERLQPAPYIPLPGDWETYLAGIRKKQRHEIRRKNRRAENFPKSIDFTILEPGPAPEDGVESFLRLMAQDPQKETFLVPAMVQQMRLIMQAGIENGWLQLAFLEVDGQPAAGYLNFDYGNRIWSYNSGWDPSFAELSPGWVLLASLLKWANEQKREAFDFLRGDEGYKYRFGARDRYVLKVTLSRK